MSQRDYQEWFEEYSSLPSNSLSDDASVIKAVESDTLEKALVEEFIQGLIPATTVKNGFCAKCQFLLNNWPTLGKSSTRQHDSKPDSQGGWEYVVARPCTTFEIEASALSGCRFCTFMLQNLKDAGLLDTFRKIEVRLYYLKDDWTASLSVQNWGPNSTQLLWINFPGKECTHCNFGIATETKMESKFLPVDGELYFLNTRYLDRAKLLKRIAMMSPGRSSIFQTGG